jgi:hypothetical protein
VSTDETINASGRKVANIVIGVLKNDQTLSDKSFLLSCKEMSAVNHTTIAPVFNEAKQTLWPHGVKFDMLLLVTDAACYMKKAAEGLSVSYPKLIHVTCVVHALHSVCETIPVLYPNVDKLVANWRKIFVKSPARIEIFKNKAPDTPILTTPVITQRGNLVGCHCVLCRKL